MLEWLVNCILRTLGDLSKERGPIYNSIVCNWAGAVMLNKAKIGQRCAFFSDWVIYLLSNRLTGWGIDWLIDRCCSVICGPLMESAKILNEFGLFRGFEKNMTSRQTDWKRHVQFSLGLWKRSYKCKIAIIRQSTFYAYEIGTSKIKSSIEPHLSLSANDAGCHRALMQFDQSQAA